MGSRLDGFLPAYGLARVSLDEVAQIFGPEPDGPSEFHAGNFACGDSFLKRATTDAADSRGGVGVQ